VPKLTSNKLNESCPYATKEELEWLQKWLLRESAGRRVPQIVIIGAGPGVMPLALLEIPRKFMMWVVELDTFQWYDAHLKSAGFEGDKRAVKIEGDSYDVGCGWLSKLDLVVVDGDHSYNGVWRDILAWTPHVRLYGRMLFHDFPHNLQQKGTGVAEAVRDRLPQNFVALEDIGISRIYQRVK
jgi:spermidine synthase